MNRPCEKHGKGHNKNRKVKKYDKKDFKGNNRHKHMLYVYTEDLNKETKMEALKKNKLWNKANI